MDNQLSVFIDKLEKTLELESVKYNGVPQIVIAISTVRIAVITASIEVKKLYGS